MHKTSIALAATLVLTLTGSAFAQTTMPGSTEGNMNNPGSVKSDTEKRGEAATGMRGTTAPDTTGTAVAPGAGMKPSGTNATGMDPTAPAAGTNAGTGMSR